MVIEYIRYKIAAEHSDEFETAYADASAALDTSQHCLGYELSRGVEEPEHWILRIEWDSIEGHEQGFRSSQEFGPFLQAVRPFMGELDEMKHYEATSVAAVK